MNTYLKFDFTVQGNKILILSEIVENISIKATKNAIVKKVMQLFNERTDIDINNTDSETIKATKSQAYFRIIEENKSMINNFLEFKKDYEVITINPILKKTNDINIIIRNNDGTTEQIVAKPYKTNVDEFKSFDLAIHKVNNKWILIDIFSGIAITTAKYKKDIEINLQNSIDKNGIDRIIQQYNKLLINLGLINDNNINTIESKEEKKEINNTNNIYTVYNNTFTTYEDAKQYCIECDFEPELMIQIIDNKGRIKTTQTIIKNDTYKNNKIKIRLLDDKINRLLDVYINTRNEIDKQGIKYNDRTNKLIIELNRLDKEMNILENKIDKFKEKNKQLDSINYTKVVSKLKNEYTSKYKVVNRETKETIYANNIEEYIYNAAYNIYMLIENREVVKQEYKNNNKYTSWLDKDVLKVFYYKNDDTINNIEKTETYYNNILIAKEIDKTKRKVHFLYTYIKDNIENICNLNTDNYNNYIDVFKDDKEIIDILETYKVPFASEENEIKSNNTYIEVLEYYINEYKNTIDKFPELKRIAENLEYYKTKYKDRYKDLFRKYKTNKSNFSNYLHNYKTLMKLKSIDKYRCKDKIITEYSFQIPLPVVYTKHYKKHY